MTLGQLRQLLDSVIEEDGSEVELQGIVVDPRAGIEPFGGIVTGDRPGDGKRVATIIAMRARPVAEAKAKMVTRMSERRTTVLRRIEGE